MFNQSSNDLAIFNIERAIVMLKYGNPKLEENTTVFCTAGYCIFRLLK